MVKEIQDTLEMANYAESDIIYLSLRIHSAILKREEELTDTDKILLNMFRRAIDKNNGIVDWAQ